MDLEAYNDIPAFSLYAEAEVSYEGRASSTLARGNYLIIKKQDGSLLIHGANHVPALNYMSGGSLVQIEDNTITATRRSETITIKIYECHQATPITGWSDNKIQIRKTEAELTETIVDHPNRYLPNGHYVPYREYPTPAGPVDLILVSTEAIFVIEVKRKKITLKDCYQIKRYLDAFDKSFMVERMGLAVRANCSITGCVAGPEISANALAHCDENNLKYLPVQFEE